MARGQQKIQAQQKNAAKQAKIKKQKEKKGAAVQLEGQLCQICRTTITNLGSSVKKLEEHVNSKHSAKTCMECFPDYDELKIKADAAAVAKLNKKSGATMDGSKQSGTGKKVKKAAGGKKKKNDLSALDDALSGLKM